MFISEDIPKNYIKIRAIKRSQHGAKTHYPKNESDNDPFFMHHSSNIFSEHANVDFVDMHQWF